MFLAKSKLLQKEIPMQFIQKSCRLLLGGALLLAFLTACGAEDAPEQTSSNSSSLSSSSIVSEASEAPEVSLISEDHDQISQEAVSSAPETLSILVRTGGETPVYDPQDLTIPHSLIPAGETLEAVAQEDILWYSTELEDGQTVNIYTPDLYPVTEDGGVSETSLAKQQITIRLDELKAQFPEGKYWNHMGQELPFEEETPFSVTDIPCDHDVYGELYCNKYNGKTLELFPQYGYLCQCLGFASLLSDQLFGREAPVYVFYDYDQLQLGDEIRLDEYEHSMIVVEKADDYVVVAEANQNYLDCRISWSRRLERYELEELSWDSEYISRYPMCRDSEGNITYRDEVAETES